MPTLIHRRVAEARRGDNPKVICQTHARWAVMGDTQFLAGYCLLLPDPVVPSLNDLTPERGALFLREMTALGDALLEVTDAIRVNYEILGNLEPALHAHVFPRFADEPDDLRHRPAWFYPKPRRPGFDLDRDRPLMQKIATHLKQRGVAAG
ncbi:MAG: hypothetical protein AAF333_08990 [Planctomycetota bacterium]